MGFKPISLMAVRKHDWPAYRPLEGHSQWFSLQIICFLVKHCRQQELPKSAKLFALTQPLIMPLSSLSLLGHTLGQTCCATSG